MSQYSIPADFLEAFADMKARLAVLERRQANPLPSFTTAQRPAPNTVPGLMIRNLTTTKAEFSDGTAWQVLY